MWEGAESLRILGDMKVRFCSASFFLNARNLGQLSLQEPTIKASSRHFQEFCSDTPNTRAIVGLRTLHNELRYLPEASTRRP